MAITVKYFASLRERLGRDQDRVEAASVSTVADCWTRIANDRAAPVNLLAAVNMEYASFDDPVEDGDEVAFFPTVTGG